MATPQTDTHAREQTRRDEQVQKNAKAARAGVEKLADFRQRATEDGLDAASQSLQNASDQFTRTLGFSAEDGERLARQSAQNVAAITNFGTVLTQAYQDISRGWYGLAYDWYGFAQEQWQCYLDGLSKLAHKSAQDFAAIQNSLVRESLQHIDFAAVQDSLIQEGLRHIVEDSR